MDFFRCGRDRMVVGLRLPMQSVPITTNVVSSNLDQDEVYNIIVRLTSMKPTEKKFLKIQFSNQQLFF